MYFPELNDIISDLHSKKSKAIENFDFENAEEIQNSQKQEINRRSELQAKYISNCIIEEFNVIQENKSKSLFLLKKKCENSKKEIEAKFQELFEDTQKQQLFEINDLEDRLNCEIEEGKSKPVPEADELLQQASKEAKVGRIQSSRNLKAAAERTLNETIQQRCDEITSRFDAEKDELMEKHSIEARNIINLKNSELKEIEKEKIKGIEKIENQYKASVNALKCKCEVQCSVLSGDSKINQNYSSSIIQNIEALELNNRNLSDERKKLKTSQKLRDDTLNKTRKILNQKSGNLDNEPEAYLKRTARISSDSQANKSSVRYLSKSFFTTQNVKNDI